MDNYFVLIKLNFKGTGDSNGFICIYSIEKLEVIRKIKLHKALIRNIVRINSK